VALCRPSASSPARGIDREALVDALCQLGQVDRLDDLGSQGPLLASAGADSLFHCLFGRDAIRMALGEAVETARLRERARQLRRRVLDQFWQPDLGTFAAAVTVEPDGALRPARVVASSAGHLLASGLLDGWDAHPPREQLIARLREPDLLAAAGVRTRSIDAARFRAGSYHSGSVWPMDTGVIADGLRRHGRPGQAADLERRVLDACVAVGGFPEFFRGDADDRLTINQHTVDAIVDGLPNRLEQPPQMVQGWTVMRVWRILRQRDVLPAPDSGHASLVAPPAMPLVRDVAVRPVRLAA
jgi:hypothetical protein